MDFDNLKLTPVMQQYVDIKKENLDSILFFRLGDFYEMFFDDAKIVSEELDLTLTARDKKSDNPIPMAGVPYHSASSYINKLIKKGYKVSICEQMSQPSAGKDIVKREVVKTITPGTLIEEDCFESDFNNYIMCLYQSNTNISICYCDISTGELSGTEINSTDIFSEIFKINPSEILLLKNNIENNIEKVLKKFFFTTEIDENDINKSESNSIEKCKNLLFNYIRKTQKNDTVKLENFKLYNVNNYMSLDNICQKSLELVPDETTGKNTTLFDILNYTKTPMGTRKLKKWILNPLTDIDLINLRQENIQELYSNTIIRKEVQQILKNIRDIERIINRLSFSTSSPRDIASLRESLKNVIKLKSMNSSFSSLKKKILKISDFENLVDYIESAFNEELPPKISDGGFIKTGFNPQLDELKNISKNSKEWLVNLEQSEREKTGIKNLKVGYNKVFGYFIEVTKSNIDKVPDEYIRKQTMTNCERFFTPELKEKEAFILGAKDRLLSLEIKLFEEIRQNVLKKYKDIIEAADIIAEIDCYCSNAEVSSRNNYIRPEILNEKIIEIEDGRHPVIDSMLKNDFIPNDTYMNNEDSSFFIITGPNMAGKSTFIRQVALLVMLAQTGMFIPASKAKIGIFNKIFTRIGAWDNLSLGQSTFMVEMNETAQILKKSDKNSLVILDEIGRGTSTYDGLSIAWAVTEYLANQKIFTLFATHYHELTASENMNKGIKNFNVAIAEENNELIFLHKIISGSADRSYGIHVAKLAGVPDEVIKKASELLHSFEKKSSYDKNNITDKEYSTPKISMETTTDELSLFKEEEVKESYFRYGEAISIIEDLKKIDINNTTPLKALNKLNQLKNKARNMK